MSDVKEDVRNNNLDKFTTYLTKQFRKLLKRKLRVINHHRMAVNNLTLL
ncbi:hypothetical protein [Lactiplantibacillus plantarum]|nr:hypothetical protein [Lactiplantibacillus plantarum]WCE45047.1 hypothetical protein PGB25_15445 [Lactiplantibacillus plantarum]